MSRHGYLRMQRMGLRLKGPNPLAWTDVPKVINGHSLIAYVSPCSWLHEGHVFQVSDELDLDGGNVIVQDPALHFANATVADVERLADTVKLAQCRHEGCTNPAFDPQTCDTNRDGFCEQHFLQELTERLQREQAQEEAEIAALDAKHRAEGCTHRIDAKIHDGNGEPSIMSFWAQDPTAATVKRALQGEGCKYGTDYRLVPLDGSPARTCPDSYSLVNGEERQKQNPISFEIPSLAERRKLQKGDYAKLIFIDLSGGSEGMWVRIEQRDKAGRYTGILDNKPINLMLSHGDTVSFLPQHIVDVAHPDHLAMTRAVIATPTPTQRTSGDS